MFVTAFVRVGVGTSLSGGGIGGGGGGVAGASVVIGMGIGIGVDLGVVGRVLCWDCYANARRLHLPNTADAFARRIIQSGRGHSRRSAKCVQPQA